MRKRMVMGVEIGRVVAATYDSFVFRSDAAVPADSFVTTSLPDGSFLFGRVGRAEAGAEGEAVYEADALRRGRIEGGGVSLVAERVPAVVGAGVSFAPTEVAAHALGFDVDPAGALRIGRAAGLDALLKPEILLRHLFVCGTTGSGKSHFLSVIVEELTRLGIPAVVFDSQKEYAGLARALGGRVLVPGADYVVPLSVLTGEEAAQMVAALEGTPGYDLFLFTFSGFLREVEAGRRQGFDLADVLRQMEADGRDALRLSGPEFRAAIARVEASLRRHRFLGPARFRTDWAGLLGAGKPVVVDCATLDLTQLQLLVGSTLRELQRLRLAGRIPRYVAFLDEAHLLVPAERETPCKQVVRENVRIGRHYGICVALATQNPLDVDRRIASQCNTRVIFAIEPDQLEALRGLAADATPSMLRGLPKLPRGTCLLVGTYETVRHAVLVEVRDLEAAKGG